MSTNTETIAQAQTNAPAQPSSENKLSLSMKELYQLAQAVSKGFDKKIYEKDEVSEIFPIWNVISVHRL